MSAAPSWRTIAVLFLGVAVIALTIGIIASGLGGESAGVAASDLGELAVVLFAAVIVLAVARSFGKGERVRTQWLAIGLGMLAFAIGDAVWAYLEVIRGTEPPYPGLPDLFYLLEYPLLAYGLITAGFAYRGLVPLKRPALVAAGVTAALLAALWFGLLGPHIVYADLTSGEKALSALYPAADILLYVGPALFVALVVRELAGGRLAWPWWAVVLGVVLLAAADTGYSWLSAYDAYEAGALIDYAWSAGHLMFAVGASLIYDLANPATRIAPSELLADTSV